MPEPADTAAAITADIVEAVASTSAQAALDAITASTNLPVAIRGQLRADLQLRAAVEAAVSAAVTARLNADAPTIIEDALAGWTPP